MLPVCNLINLTMILFSLKKRGANVEKWSEQLKSKQAAEGLEFYRKMMLDSFQNQSADYNFSNSLKKTTPCLRAEHYNKAAAELLVIGL